MKQASQSKSLISPSRRLGLHNLVFQI